MSQSDKILIQNQLSGFLTSMVSKALSITGNKDKHGTYRYRYIIYIRVHMHRYIYMYINIGIYIEYIAEDIQAPLLIC